MTANEFVYRKIDEFKEEKYALFHKKLLNNNKITVNGVRVPVMKNIAKELAKTYSIADILSVDDKCYESTFIKLQAFSIAKMTAHERFEKLDELVCLLDNWATCDSLKIKEISSNKENFLSHIEQYLKSEKEFVVRFALVQLLNFYVEKEYFDYIFSVLEGVDNEKYYVHMASAWLTAEIIIKDFERGAGFLKRNSLDIKTHNKAIQKSRESFRLTSEQKEYIKELKR